MFAPTHLGLLNNQCTTQCVKFAVTMGMRTTAIGVENLIMVI